ncbi:ATP-grasp ribosomal peptide maturase [Streptomyces sp. NBC_01477]|uniref:ATP-grasp ribosomal peptide maturase n=1 Tax=Streptomyces sp. NBC_01477 TaxID=2976015 RepID=UPI002E327F35|nr:ATP-grasp ribosomal peptide maturase [Streptomyces sp. NBC_01477]
MDRRPVLVSTEYEDPTADVVIAELNRRRVPVLRFDPGRDFPDSAGIDARLGPEGWSGTLTVGDRTAELHDIRALYHRRPTPYVQGAAGQTARFAEQENRRGLGGVLGALAGCLYLSHPQAIARAEYKPAQLAVAAALRMSVPATLITADLYSAREFAAEQPTIYKPLHAGPYAVNGEPAGIWAAPVLAEDIGDGVRHSAHLFQAQVPKVADVRAVVVGTEVFCARITAPRGVVDWRAAYTSLSYEAVDCPAAIRAALHRFLGHFSLSYGAFDFAITADGVWWFLECNPNGQWGWLEAAAGLPIGAAVADLLENGEAA